MKKFHVLCALLVGICCAFQGATPASGVEAVQVVVSIPPQIYFVQQIGGDRVEVMSMLPEGGFPHEFEPRPEQMTRLNNADLYIRINVEFENAWWDKMAAANPNMYVVDSTIGIESIEGHAHHHHDEEGEPHEHEGEHYEHEGEQRDEADHRHHGRDPHVWLSPKNVKIQAEAICAGLIHVDPEHQETYLANKDTFLQALDQLDHEIQQQLANLRTRKFMIFHPAWSYYARDYNLEQIPIEIEGKEPSAKEMAELMKTAQTEGITAIFVQPQTSRRSAETIAQHISAEVKVIDPLTSNWMENMRRVTAILVDTLSKED